MGATTPKGYPYPVGTDRVSDGDNAIQALAEASDTKAGVHACGNVTVNASGSPVVGSIAVTFPVGRFSSPPTVTATAQASNPGAYQAGAHTVTATGAMISGARGTAGAVPVGWHAVQVD